MARKDKRIARYELVALDIADQISNGKYELGARIHGRSTLASLYKVSPETIRKAMAILEKQEIVEVVHGSGIRVISIEKAIEFLNKNNVHQNLLNLVDSVYENIRNQKALIAEMEDLMQAVVEITRRG